MFKGSTPVSVVGTYGKYGYFEGSFRRDFEATGPSWQACTFADLTSRSHAHARALPPSLFVFLLLSVSLSRFKGWQSGVISVAG